MRLSRPGDRRARRGPAPAWLCALAAAMLAVPAPAQHITVFGPDDEQEAVGPDRAPSAHPPLTVEQVAARPDSAGRVVQIFDFEERETNPLPVPQNWIRAQHDPAVPRDRPGFPIWNGAQLDYQSPARSGIGTVHLPTEGGSTSLVLRPGAVAVFPNADYLITGFVRTEGLRHARARLTARFLDEDGNPIEGSEARSAVVRTRGEWYPLALGLVGDFADAVFIQVELQLLQPEQYAEPTLEPRFQVWPQDYSGSAWFDDVAIVQLPRIELSTPSPGNVIVGPDEPVVSALVRDLTGERLRIEFRVLDIDGREVDRRSRVLAGGRLRADWVPTVERYGWYRALLEVFTESRRVGASSVDFVWVPPASPVTGGSRSGRDEDDGPLPAAYAGSPDRSRFGLEVRSVPDRLLPTLPRLADASGVGGVTLAVWQDDTTLDGFQGFVRSLIPTVDRLLEQWLDVTLSFARVPEEASMLAGVDQDDPLRLFLKETADWRELSESLLDRYGQRVRRWQIGTPGDLRLFDDAGLAERVARAERELSRLVPGPIMTIPWRTDQALQPDVLGERRAIHALVVPGTDPDAFEMLHEDWRRAVAASPLRDRTDVAEPPELKHALEPIDPEGVGGRAAAADLSRRGILWWKAFGAEPVSRGRVTMSLVEPWGWSAGRRPELLPRPELAAWRNLVERLSDREVVAELDFVPGLRSYLLAPKAGAAADRGGAIVAWRGRGAAEDTVLDVFLGEGDVRVIDMFGNAVPAPVYVIADLGLPSHRVPIGTEPVFIEGIDVELVRFLTSIRLEPGSLVSRHREHVHDLVFENPWPRAIRGRFFIVEPGGLASSETAIDRSWRVEPRASMFAASEMGSGRIPLRLAFSAVEEAGPKEFVIDVEFADAREHGIVRVRRQVELGLPEASLELTYRQNPGDDTDDLGVQAQVTNLSDEPLTIELLARAPGLPRGRASIGELAPGETVVRTFAFPGALAALRGERVAVSLVIAGTDARLNRSVLIE